MNKWNERSRPIRLEKRFEFESYQLTRDFLDKLGELCELRTKFPDISFGKTYVNLTIQTDEQDSILTDSDRAFASEIDELLN